MILDSGPFDELMSGPAKLTPVWGKSGDGVVQRPGLFPHELLRPIPYTSHRISSK